MHLKKILLLFLAKIIKRSLGLVLIVGSVWLCQYNNLGALKSLIISIFTYCLYYPAGAAAGSYIASVSSSSSSFFFFFFLSTSLFLLQLTWYDHVTQVIFISLMTATKLMGLEIHLGSFGVTGVKKVNHVKNMKTALI